MKRLDLLGERFGRLVVTEFAGIENGATTWLCSCDCKNVLTVSVGRLRSGHTQSCGCLHKEKTSIAKATHRLSNTKLYRIWQNMLNRCRNSSTDRYHRYGGRGIKVCKEWKRFEPFLDWSISNGYYEGLSIERKDVDGNYEPSNCKWIPLDEQQGNTSRSRLETYNGRTQTISKWAREMKVNYKRLSSRLCKGWDIEKALITP